MRVKYFAGVVVLTFAISGCASLGESPNYASLTIDDAQEIASRAARLKADRFNPDSESRARSLEEAGPVELWWKSKLRENWCELSLAMTWIVPPSEGRPGSLRSIVPVLAYDHLYRWQGLPSDSETTRDAFAAAALELADLDLWMVFNDTASTVRAESRGGRITPRRCFLKSSHRWQSFAIREIGVPSEEICDLIDRNR